MLSRLIEEPVRQLTRAGGNLVRVLGKTNLEAKAKLEARISLRHGAR